MLLWTALYTLIIINYFIVNNTIQIIGTVSRDYNEKQKVILLINKNKKYIYLL